MKQSRGCTQLVRMPGTGIIRRNVYRNRQTQLHFISQIDHLIH